MSKQNKFFAVATTAALVASAIVPVASAAEFKDANQIAPWAKEAVETLAAKDIIGGNPDGSFNPKGNVTRAEAAKMFKVALDLPVEGTEAFTDVKDGQWFQDVIIAVSNAGIVDGMGNGLFAPNGKLTRAEAAKMIVKAYGFEGEADLSKFADANAVAGKWFEAPLSTAVAAGIIAGKGNLLAANDSITRQEFAVMLTRAIDTAQEANAEELLAAVEEATTALDTAVKALNTEVKATEVAAAKAEVEAAKKALTALETAVADAKDVMTTEATTKVTTAVATAKKAIETTEAAIELALADPEVLAVEAINALEIKVTFNKPVSKDSFAATDFVVTKTADSSPVNITDAQLAKDGKSATLLLATVIPATGVDVNIAEGALLTTDFDKFVKSSSKALKAAEDTTAPKLLSANYVGGTDIELTFDEPIDWATNAPVVKIDQTVVNTPSVSTVAGKYVYTISAANALSNGTHTVDLQNVTDFAGNKDVLTSKEVVVTIDNSAAKVASIKANDSTSFIVEFSKAVALPSASNFEIKKGNLTIDSTNFTVTPALVDENGNAVAGSSSKYVKVTIADAAGNTANPLYGANDSSVALSVKVSGYKDASTVLGTEFSGSVTLAKDLTAPAIKSEKLISSTATTIVLPFTKTLTSTTAGTVTVKNGNVLVAQTAAVAGENLTLTFDSGVLEPGKTYTITLAKGAAVSGTQSSEATTITYTVPTTAVSYTTTAPVIVASKANGKNVLTLTYTGKVNDAAGLASSYKLNDAELPVGTDVYFESSAKNKVIIELPASYTVSTENKAAKFTINADTIQYDAAVLTEGSKFVSGSASSSKAYETAITLKDNVAPVVSKVEYVKNTAGLATGVKLTFSEAIEDTSVDAANFVVTQGTTPVAYTVAAGVPVTSDLEDDNVLNLTFTTPVVASGLVINTNTDNTKLTLTDAYGNKLGAISAISAQ